MPVAEANTATTAAAAACRHCGLPVPPARRAPDSADAFCCDGCATAWAILHDAGLSAAYAALPERRAAAVTPSGRTFDAFDHPSFQAAHVERAGTLACTELYLEGIHCASCVWLVERTPRLVPGLASAVLDVGRARVRLAWDPARTTLAAVARGLDTLGYRPHPFRGARAADRRRAEDRGMLIRIGVAGALAGNVMMLALALYAGDAGGMDAATRGYFRWVSLLLTAPALLGPGLVFFRGALGALRARTLHMDLPVALALAAGFARGASNTVTGTGPIYFDGVTALVFLLLVGRFLQQRAQRAALDSTELLAAFAPAVARRLEGGVAVEVPADSLLPGDRVEVRAGETLPADGTVERGHSDLDQSLLTGEPRPLVVGPGSAVLAGTVNRVASLVLRVEKAGEETRVGRLAREVEAGTARRAPVVRTADRMAGVFVAAVLVLAAITWATWMRRDPARAVDQAIALLVVTCPCALALATPLAITAAIGRAARAGILVKGGDALERLGRGGRMVLDKTGTLTEGRMALVDWEGEDTLRPLVLAAERGATHPVARAFTEAWPRLPVPEARDVRLTPGGGLEADVLGRRVVVGSPAFVATRCGLARPAPASDDGLTPVWVAVDGAVRGRARLGDAVRPEAAAVLAGLRARGWSLSLLSGDDPGAVDAVGRALGFGAGARRGGTSPETKLAAIESLEREGPVVMVGDGVNDAAAIARASVGVSVRGGAEASLAAADVYLARPGLRPLGELVAGSRRTLGVIRRTIALSLAYNAIGATLAMLGYVTPLVAAILMPASSISAVLLCGLGRTFDVEGEHP